MRTKARSGLVAAAFAFAVLAGCAAASSFEAVHADSRPHDLGFVEVFRVTRAPSGLAPDALTFRLDGLSVTVEWNDPDGVVSKEDEFSFVAEAYDTMRHLEAFHDGARLWETDYAGGSGAPLG